jgi:hypothetical protein
MSMQDYREGLVGIPGAERLTMRYEDGGKIQAFSIDDKTVRVGPTARPAEVKAAFLGASQK